MNFNLPAKPLSVCVYCGSRVGSQPLYRQVAEQLGRELAWRGQTLVYGGGSIGLMGVVADAVLAAGGQAIGIIPEHLHIREVGHAGLSRLEIVHDMHSRKQRMFQLSDAFLVLPGGTGTLDETVEILTWRQLDLHDKPIVLLDAGGYWQPLLALLEHFIGQGFAGADVRRLYRVARDVPQALDLIGALAPSPAPAHPERM
ncbi:MAG: TIGR00730 family Rossman fold protein [Alphaproteobacteria bacterium]|nr:TIGR00730 family Rossman fold protein [Alphaproteobacteria bacterium]